VTRIVDEPTPLNVQIIAESPASTVIQVSGEVDADNSAAFQHDVSDLLHSHTAGMVALDLSKLTFLGSAGIRALLACHDEAEQQGRHLSISRAHTNTLDVLTICDLSELFDLPPARIPEQDPSRFWRPWW
jgi:anti-anti-sigma factor